MVEAKLGRMWSIITQPNDPLVDGLLFKAHTGPVNIDATQYRPKLEFEDDTS